MLSERERQALDEIERTISRSDPRLAAMLSTARRVRAARWDRLAHDLVIIVSALSAILCISLGQVGAGLVAGVFAVLVLAVRRSRFAPPSGPTPPGQRKPPSRRFGR